MRSSFIINLALFCAAVGSPAQTPPPAVPREAICGFTSNFRYCDAAGVRDGLSVDLFVGDAQVNQPVKLRFYVNRKPGDFPVDGLQVEHERLMHVIGVRDDLSGFFHIHPLRVGPGLYLVSYAFTNGGHYKIWSDVKYNETSYGFAHPMLDVTGKIEPSANSHEARDYAIVSGYRVTLSHPQPLAVGNTNQLEFVIRDASGKQIETDNFLGAPMHLVIVKDDLSVYRHGHPESHGPAGSVIRFYQLFPQPGTYKLFAQFRPRNTTLPQDDAILAEFYVNVAPDGSVPVSQAAK